MSKSSSASLSPPGYAQTPIHYPFNIISNQSKFPQHSIGNSLLNFTISKILPMTLHSNHRAMNKRPTPRLRRPAILLCQIGRMSSKVTSSITRQFGFAESGTDEIDDNFVVGADVVNHFAGGEEFDEFGGAVSVGWIIESVAAAN